MSTACTASPETTETHCFVQHVSIADKATDNAIERGLRVSNTAVNPDNVNLQGITTTGKILDETMGFIMKKDNPINHNPQDGSLIGWCRTDTKVSEKVISILVHPLFTSIPSFSVVDTRERYPKNSPVRALLDQVAPGGHTAVAIPSESISPVKPPKTMAKVLQKSNTVAEVTPVNNVKGTSIWTADLTTAEYTPRLLPSKPS